jgi:hypothetical protein
MSILTVNDQINEQAEIPDLAARLADALARGVTQQSWPGARISSRKCFYDPASGKWTVEFEAVEDIEDAPDAAELAIEIRTMLKGHL